MQTFTAEIPMSEYIAGFRDVATFADCCRACPNYAGTWNCPPFDYDIEAELKRYSRIRIMAVQVDADPASAIADAMDNPRLALFRRSLLDMEARLGGRAFSLGHCRECPVCSRPQPCRHPDRCRPSLESYGFDVGKTMSELLGIKLQWGRGGRLPAVMTFVGAVMYN